MTADQLKFRIADTLLGEEHERSLSEATQTQVAAQGPNRFRQKCLISFREQRSLGATRAQPSDVLF